MDKKQEYLDLSLKHLQIADHMAYVTYPLVKEKKLLLKIFDEMYKSVINLVCASLIFENKKKNIKFNKDLKENMKIFIKLSKNYRITSEEIKKMSELIEINYKHKTSAMEFSRKENVVMMMDNLDTFSLDIRKIKEYITLSKSLYLKINLRLNI